jgi:AraC-like DNA-binding protein
VQHAEQLHYVHVITSAIKQMEVSHFQISIEDIAATHQVSTRTLQRYFEATTSLTSKKVFQIMRIRKAVEAFIKDPDLFDYSTFGYYDHSHFYKHLKSFFDQHNTVISKPHLRLLQMNNG